jgi:hypothetical protein
VGTVYEPHMSPVETRIDDRIRVDGSSASVSAHWPHIPRHDEAFDREAPPDTETAS